jgi:G:T-mismatch repair DNA endonuclease (very short patch repair protein)
LMATGWQVVTIWECEVENGLFMNLPLFRAPVAP